MWDKETLKTYFLTDNKSGHKTRINHVNKNFDGLYDVVISYNKKFEDIAFPQMLYNYLFEIDTPPKCRVCGKKLKFKNLTENYPKVCNRTCMKKDATRLEKIRETTKERYGEEYISMVDSVKEKRKETYLKKYGVENIFENDQVKEKTKKTNIEKYGTEHAISSEKVKKKRIKNNIKKYGVKSPSQLDSAKQKMIETNREKYGVDHVMQNQEVKKRNVMSSMSTSIDEYKKILGEHVDFELYKGLLKVKNQCDVHKEYFIDKRLFYYRVKKYKTENPCIICNPVNEIKSFKEIEISEYLESLGFNVERNNREALEGKELDTYVPEKNIGIEFNGLYWHCDLFKQDTYHLLKTEVANSKGIELFHIFEDEWLYKKEIVKSILKAKLGIVENRIFARKCEIKEITSKESKVFLEENHIQGSINASIRLGLFYDGSLVTLMTFGKKRKVMGSKSVDGEFEMYRFCNKLNTSVIGGASRLLKYFVNNYAPKKIISYADRRYSTGNLYEKLGFNFVKTTEPNYWYFKKPDYIRYHRFNFRKDVLVKEGYDKNLSEYEIMISRNYFRIFDCGNIKYELVLD
jgi:hypothetical protein